MVDRVAAMHIERIEDIERFEGLRDEWSDLLLSRQPDCIFLTWEWLFTWWKHLSEGRRLCLLTVRRDRRLVAVAPLARSPRTGRGLWFLRPLQFLGTGSAGSDYLDIIVRQGDEAEAVDALAGYLAQQRVPLELSQVATHGVAWGLASRLRGQSWASSRARTDVCPFIDLTASRWPDYLATRSPALRYNFRRRMKNLAKLGRVEFEPVRSDEERREVMRLLIGLHQLRWRPRGGSTAFHRSALLAFHDEFSRVALERGWLRLFALRLDERPLACLYGFRYGRTFYFYQSGFDPGYEKQSVGLVMMGLAIKAAIEEGAEEYDLLHGDESYKFHWAPNVRELGRLELYPPHLPGVLGRHVVGLNRVLRRTARRLLPPSVVDRLAPGSRASEWGARHATRAR